MRLEYVSNKKQRKRKKISGKGFRWMSNATQASIAHYRKLGGYIARRTDGEIYRWPKSGPWQ